MTAAGSPCPPTKVEEPMQLPDHDRYDYLPLPARPDYSWPDGKRLAVCFCNNIEVFAFGAGLGSDSAVIGAPQSQRNYAWRDYGNRVGMWYLFDLFDELNVPASHNVNSVVFEQLPGDRRAHRARAATRWWATAAPTPSARACSGRRTRRA